MNAAGGPALAWLQLVVCGGVVAAAGTLLTRYADAIADKTGWSRAWIGLVLLATVTSLPELATGISSVAFAGAPDVAVGNVLGACVLNLSYVAVLDLLKRDEPLFGCTGQEHVGLAGFGVVMLGLGGLGLAIEQLPLPYSLGHIGWYTPVLLLLYLAGVRSSFARDRAPPAGDGGRADGPGADLSLRQAAVRCLAAAGLVVAAGSWLPHIATELAGSMQWSRTFVGTLLVSFVTSLPELVVTLSALRMGAIDMAVANLLGSNMFNVVILAIDDVFYAPGPILGAVSPVHIVSAMSAVTMNGVVVIALQTRPSARVLRMASWSSLALGGMHVLSAYVLFRHGA